MKSPLKSIKVHDELLTLAEVAAYLKVSRKTVFRMIRRRQMPAVKIGRLWRIRRGWIQEWVDSKRKGPLPQLLEELVQGLRSLYGSRLRGIHLYGSYARGEARPDSDLDLLVVLDDFSEAAEELRRAGPLASRLSLDSGIPVALMFVRKRDFEARRTPFLMNVRQEAKPLAA